jgi:PAS domain S-box-containing protein
MASGAKRRQAQPVETTRERLLASVFERISDGVVALDRDWRYVYVNQKAAQMLQRESPEDLIGRHIWTEYPDGVGQPFYHAYLRAMATQQVVVLEDHYEPWDLWFENRIYPSPEGLTIYFTEITQRKRAELAARQAQEQLQQAVRAAKVGLWDWDLRTHRVHFSPEWKQQIGYQDHEITDDFGEWESRVHPDDLAQARQTAQAFIQHPWPHYHTEFRFRHRDGSYRWILAQASLVCDEQGQPIRMLGSHIDITESKRVEEELRNSKVFLESIQAGAHLGGWELNPATGAGFWSEEMFRLHGLAPGSSPPSLAEFMELVHPEDREELRRRHHSAVQSGTPFTCEYRTNPERCPPRVINASVQCVKNKDGEVVLLIGANLDITAHKQAEEELRRLNAELEQRVAERTAQLLARNRELETFTYAVSHDLKAPLRGIDGYSRLLLEDYAEKLDEEGRAFVHTIRQATLQMGQLIDDLLAYSRLEHRPLHTGLVDLQALAESLVAEREGEIRARGAALRLALPGVEVSADPEGLGLALRNLLDNALKFTRDVPQPAIEIGGRQTQAGWVLWVRDNGPGFDMKFRERIFEIFQRLHRPEDYPGTGIGLAIVRKALERLGGRAWAESEPGQGAAFFLEIPP